MCVCVYYNLRLPLGNTHHCTCNSHLTECTHVTRYTIRGSFVIGTNHRSHISCSRFAARTFLEAIVHTMYALNRQEMRLMYWPQDATRALARSRASERCVCVVVVKKNAAAATISCHVRVIMPIDVRRFVM